MKVNYLEHKKSHNFNFIYIKVLSYKVKNK